MKDDMRLKSLVFKNASKLTLPCLGQCANNDDCPCDKMKAYVKKLPNSSTLEMEWMYVPTVKSATFWTKVVVLIALMLIGLYFIKAGCCSVFCGKKDGIKVSLERNGCRVERIVSSAVEFEKSTNDLTKVLMVLKRIGATND